MDGFQPNALWMGRGAEDFEASSALGGFFDARGDYGLVAANPFGVGHFEGKKRGPGHRLKKGESLVLLYRFLFHSGDAASVDIDRCAKKFASIAPSSEAVQPNKSKDGR